MFCNLRHWLFWNTCFAFYQLHFWLYRQSIILLWVHRWAQSLEYSICKIKYCWRSIDALFHDRVRYVWFVVSIEKAATTLSMNCYHIATLRLPKISLSNGSGPSLRDQVRVETKPSPNWLSGLSIIQDCLVGYRSMVNSQPVELGGLSASRPAGPSIDSYKALEFGVC